MQARRVVLLVLAAIAASECKQAEAPGSANEAANTVHPTRLVWERMTDNAGFPPSYNFPVHVAADGRFVALHAEGTWVSRDGARWTRAALPWSGLNAAHLKYVQHEGATWALGTVEGNYERFSIDPVVRRTANYESWKVVGRSATLPHLIFYAVASFRGAMWILGGYNNRRVETAEVWRSVDGLAWQMVLAQAPWSARSGAQAVAFRDRLYLIGGGRIDGPNANDVWSTADGTEWKRETGQIAVEEAGGSPIVFQDRLWLVGANRSGRFTSAVLVTDDGRAWQPESAPWPPRGAVAVWTSGDSLFMSGGKYSTVVRGETVFTYYNDVWRLRAVSASR